LRASDVKTQENMLSEAEAVADGKSDFATYDDVFGKEG
jgi:hypothetical protein